LYNLHIGQGKPISGLFENIDWALHNKYVQVELLQNGSYTSLGTTQLLSVPYALYALKSGTAAQTLNDKSARAGTLNYLSKFDATGASNAEVNSQLIDNGTSMGINTTAPGGKLHIRQTALASNVLLMEHVDSTGFGRFSFYNDAGFANRATFTRYGSKNTSTIAPLFPAANLLAFGCNKGSFLISTAGDAGISVINGGTSRLKFFAEDSTLNVGIGGNTFPLSRVHINNTDGINTDVRITNNTSGHLATDGLVISENGNNASIINTENANLTLGTNNTNRVSINNTGNVSINTPSAGNALLVNGTMQVTGGAPALGKVLTSDATGNATWQTLPSSPSYTAGTGISIAGTTITNTGDLSNTNELQTLSLSGTNLTLSSGGGTVALPTGPTYTAGSGISISGGAISATDASPTNELQTLSLVGTTLNLSGGGGSVTLPSGGGGAVSSCNTYNNILPRAQGLSCGLVNSQIFDDSANVGIGTGSPTAGFHVRQDPFQLGKVSSIFRFERYGSGSQDNALDLIHTSSYFGSTDNLLNPGTAVITNSYLSSYPGWQPDMAFSANGTAPHITINHNGNVGIGLRNIGGNIVSSAQLDVSVPNAPIANVGQTAIKGTSQQSISDVNGIGVEGNGGNIGVVGSSINSGVDFNFGGQFTSSNNGNGEGSLSIANDGGILGIAPNSTKYGAANAAYTTAENAYGTYGIGNTQDAFGNAYGLYGSTSYFTQTMGRGYGVFGTGKQTGVYGEAAVANDVAQTDYAANLSFTEAIGVHGKNTAALTASSSSLNIGVAGTANAPVEYNIGMLAEAANATNTNIALLAVAPPADPLGVTTNVAAYLDGDASVTGTLDAVISTAAVKAFTIDHPLDPKNKVLRHSSVESPDMMNIYNGNITTNTNGEAIVTMPNYFEALNQDFRYQLTCIGTFAQAIILKEMENNTFIIKTNQPNVKVSWQVTGVRHDAAANTYRIKVEENKTANKVGRYITPQAYTDGIEQAPLFTPNKYTLPTKAQQAKEAANRAAADAKLNQSIQKAIKQKR
jgi:hypothetical protein